ncbi:MAG: phage/plasmid primase, P4 family, partial [Thermoplasmata archaeon]|nr:phage/plasmid primase, P4 family [Thermoplasmata archaeon]
RSWGKRSSTKARIESCLAIASHREGVPVLPDDLDKDPWLLNVRNGTLDLRTGELRTPEPNDLITRVCAVRYDPKASAPTWEGFVSDAMMERADVVSFLQRVAGFSLTGSNREQRFLIHWGGGNNGKSTFLSALRSVLGDYAWHAESGAFLRQETPRVRQDLAVLRGVRLVTTSEIEDGKRLDEDLVKRITGGDPIQARHLYSRVELQFVPVCKLMMAVNHKPAIHGQDAGIWRRVLLLPWEWSIPDDRLDKDFLPKLGAEAEGILAWAVAGCRDYLTLNGLAPPETITKASASYREESDSLAEFLSEALEEGASGMETTSADVYGAYRGWCVAHHEKPLSARLLGRALTERGYVPHRTKTARYWKLSLSADGQRYLVSVQRPLREESFYAR